MKWFQVVGLLLWNSSSCTGQSFVAQRGCWRGLCSCNSPNWPLDVSVAPVVSLLSGFVACEERTVRKGRWTAIKASLQRRRTHREDEGFQTFQHFNVTALLCFLCQHQVYFWNENTEMMRSLQHLWFIKTNYLMFQRCHPHVSCQRPHNETALFWAKCLNCALWLRKELMLAKKKTVWQTIDASTTLIRCDLDGPLRIPTLSGRIGSQGIFVPFLMANLLYLSFPKDTSWLHILGFNLTAGFRWWDIDHNSAVML